MSAAVTQSAPSWGSDVSRLKTREFWVVGLAFLTAYLFLNTITNSHQFAKSGITLWSPDNGLSLLLILESPLFAPIVIVGAVIADVFISHVNYGIVTIIGSEMVLAFGYFVISIALRDVFKFKIGKIEFDKIVVLIILLPIASAFSMILYCGILYLSGALPLTLLYSAAYRFWMGDTVGMIVIIPAAIAFQDIVKNRKWQSDLNIFDFSIFLLMCAFCAIIIFESVSSAKTYYLFYLLFLPVIWVCVKYGFLGAAILLLVIQIFVISALTYFRIEDYQFGIFQALMFVLSATGLLMGVVITEREAAERLLRDQRAELARVGAQAAAGAMASTVAHEISQPLSAMAAFVRSACLLLDSDRTDANVSAARAALLEAEAQGKRTRAIIERVRDFVSGGALLLEPVDILQLGEKIVRLSIDDAHRRGVTILIEPVAPALMIQADRIAIEQALNNLVTNAVDSAAERNDGEGRVKMSLAYNDDFVVIDVDDNGTGVLPEVSERLFETFVTTKSQGMGLGLPLALEVARRHAGRLTWRQLEPRGARFTLELPLRGPE